MFSGLRRAYLNLQTGEGKNDNFNCCSTRRRERRDMLVQRILKERHSGGEGKHFSDMEKGSLGESQGTSSFEKNGKGPQGRGAVGWEKASIEKFTSRLIKQVLIEKRGGKKVNFEMEEGGLKRTSGAETGGERVSFVKGFGGPVI